MHNAPQIQAHSRQPHLLAFLCLYKTHLRDFFPSSSGCDVVSHYPMRMRKGLSNWQYHHCCRRRHHPHKIARSRLLHVSASVQYGHNVEYGKKVMSLCFKALDKGHKGYKSCFLIGHAYQPHLLKLISYAQHDCACLSSAQARVARSMGQYNIPFIALQLSNSASKNSNTRYLQLLVHATWCTAMVKVAQYARGMCSRELQFFLHAFHSLAICDLLPHSQGTELQPDRVSY